MPYNPPTEPTQHDAYNRQLQESFSATRRTAPPQPGAGPAAAPTSFDPVGALKDLAQLHASGAISDEEFATAKAKVLGPAAEGP